MAVSPARAGGVLWPTIAGFAPAGGFQRVTLSQGRVHQRHRQRAQLGQLVGSSHSHWGREGGRGLYTDASRCSQVWPSLAAAAGAAAAAASSPAPERHAKRARRRVAQGKVSEIRSVPPGIPKPPYLGKDVRYDLRTGLPAHPYLHCIEIKTPAQIESMRAACALARETLEVAGKAVAPGVTTDEIDVIVHEHVISCGAYPSPLGYKGFPKSVCTSVNDIIAHGIPDDRPLEDGDILNIDVTVYLDGYHGDTSSMFLVGAPDEDGLKLCRTGQEAMQAGIATCGPGVDFREIGKSIEAVSDAAGCYNCHLFAGHGIGSYFHGAPEVIPVMNTVDQGAMLPGMIFTVEPILIENDDDTWEEWDDFWTVQTRTNARSAQFEHTILITEDGVEVLTGPSVDYEAIAGVASGQSKV